MATAGRLMGAILLLLPHCHPRAVAVLLAYINLAGVAAAAVWLAVAGAARHHPDPVDPRSASRARRSERRAQP